MYILLKNVVIVTKFIVNVVILNAEAVLLDICRRIPAN